MGKQYVSVADYESQKVMPLQGKSMTRPDMTLSVQQILIKYANGGRINAVPGEYTGDELLPDMARMDLVDIDHLRASNEHEIARLTKQRDELLEKDAKRQEAALKRQQDVFSFYERQLQKLQSNESVGANSSVEVRENA